MFNRRPTTAVLEIFETVKKGNPKELQPMIDKHPEINLVTAKCHGKNLFESLLTIQKVIDIEHSKNYFEVVKYLLEYGVKPLTVKQANANGDYHNAFSQDSDNNTMAFMMLLTGKTSFPQEYEKNHSQEQRQKIELLVRNYESFNGVYQLKVANNAQSWISRFCCGS